MAERTGEATAGDLPAALVTGGGRGIGLETARELSKRGYRVAIADADPGALTHACNELGDGPGDRPLPLEGSVTDSTATDRWMGEIQDRFGRLDVLVNNAGVTAQAPVHDIDDADWDRLIGIHLGGTFRVSRSALPLLSASPHAAVVNMSSVVAERGLPNRSSYTAAKAGIEGLTRALAIEWAPRRIRVNAVAPGWTRTRMFEDTVDKGLVDPRQLEQAVPLGRLANPRDIAATIAFLASLDAAYITGQVVVIDGGLTIRFPFDS